MPQRPELGQTESGAISSVWVSLVSGRDPSTCMIIHCLQRYVSKKLDPKQMSLTQTGTQIWDAGIPSIGLTHFTIMPTPEYMLFYPFISLSHYIFCFITVLQYLLKMSSLFPFPLLCASCTTLLLHITFL